MEAYEYTIDDKPYTWQGLLSQAEEWGWNPGQIRMTSAAAGYLRKIGHKVGTYTAKGGEK